MADNTDEDMATPPSNNGNSPHETGALSPSPPQADIPQYLQLLVEGTSVCGDSKNARDTRPDWLDLEKFRRGQKFARDYLFGLVFAEMLTLLGLFSFPDSLQPLIFTRGSDTPFKAFKRYLSTVTRVKSWYEDDIWSSETRGQRNLQTVRAMHNGVRHRLNLESEMTLKQPLWCKLTEELRQDFSSSCPYSPATRIYSAPRGGNRVFINQADMAVTQFGFVGLMVLYPKRFGAGGASEDDLEAFCHLWAICSLNLCDCIPAFCHLWAICSLNLCDCIPAFCHLWAICSLNLCDCIPAFCHLWAICSLNLCDCIPAFCHLWAICSLNLCDCIPAFCHLWRAVGYLLGVEDRYNFCSGSLEDVRERSKDLIQWCIKPSLREVSQEWEHMSRCLVEGISYYIPGVSFEASLMYLTRLLDISAPCLVASLTVWQNFMFHLTWFVMSYFLRLPGVLAVHNWLLNVALHRANKASHSWLHRLENKSYSFQKTHGVICTKL
uniref:ER-bound oxygenase mpaB/mpaB'/Rubber oxygenase catalytic domain-containing protein n=1 Tax=Timema shepardi TaxID=629360 RepID=A0A7R9APU5_TIMSH|nr:unnamed protein product [Timema shepardi]